MLQGQDAELRKVKKCSRRSMNFIFTRTFAPKFAPRSPRARPMTSYPDTLRQSLLLLRLPRCPSLSVPPPPPPTWSLPLFCTSTHATFSWSGVSVESLRQPTACTFSPRMSIFHLLFYSLVVLHFDCSFWLLYWLHHWCCFPNERTFKYRINKTFPFC